MQPSVIYVMQQEENAQLHISQVEHVSFRLMCHFFSIPPGMRMSQEFRLWRIIHLGEQKCYRKQNFPW